MDNHRKIKPPIEWDDLVSPAKVCDILDLRLVDVYRLMYSGDLAFVWSGPMRFLSLKEVLKYKEDHA